MLYIIIFVYICLSYGLKNNNIKLNLEKKITNIEKNVIITNLDNFDEKRGFYFILGEKNEKNKKMMRDIEEAGLNGILVSKRNYSKEDLIDLFEKDIADKRYLGKDPWIFNENKFIGSSEELYKFILKKRNL